MGNPYLGEVRITGFTFAPVGWAFCDGSLLSIADNSALFSILGTTYGGDGVNNFALPDLRGRVPVHVSTSTPIGAPGGSEGVSLTSQQIPVHNHPSAACSNGPGSTGTPSNGVTWSLSKLGSLYLGNPPGAAMSPQAIANAGGNLPHENRQPSLAINYVIALFGIYPSHN